MYPLIVQLVCKVSNSKFTVFTSSCFSSSFSSFFSSTGGSTNLMMMILGSSSFIFSIFCVGSSSSIILICVESSCDFFSSSSSSFAISFVSKMIRIGSIGSSDADLSSVLAVSSVFESFCSSSTCCRENSTVSSLPSTLFATSWFKTESSFFFGTSVFPTL